MLMIRRFAAFNHGAHENTKRPTVSHHPRYFVRLDYSGSRICGVHLQYWRSISDASSRKNSKESLTSLRVFIDLAKCIASKKWAGVGWWVSRREKVFVFNRTAAQK